MEKEKRILKFLYRDQYNMPVYIDNTGQYWMDIDCREGQGLQIYSFFLNDPSCEGPDMPVPDNIELVFEPERVIDPADSKLKMIYIV